MPKIVAARKVALVYDWGDTKFGGAERVLLALKKIYPQADLFVSVADSHQASWLQEFSRVRVSFLQKFPRLIKKHKALLAIFLPLAFESFDFSGYELIISVSSFAAKGILTKPGQFHLCYLLTPTRFLYSHENEYLPWWLKPLLLPIKKYLCSWDKVAIHRPDCLLAISQLVAKRCQRFYGRVVDEVVYPTIINDIFTSSNKISLEKKYFLVVSRLVAYKKIDLALQACGQEGLPLKIIGSGKQLPQLQKLAHRYHWQQIEFLPQVLDSELPSYYRGAIALLAPAQEDFGINLLEANSCDTLVITNALSGARELLNHQTAWDLQRGDLAELRLLLRRASALGSKNLQVKFLGYNTREFTKVFKQVEEKYHAA